MNSKIIGQFDALIAMSAESKEHKQQIIDIEKK